MPLFFWFFFTIFFKWTLNIKQHTHCTHTFTNSRKSIALSSASVHFQTNQNKLPSLIHAPLAIDGGRVLCSIDFLHMQQKNPANGNRLIMAPLVNIGCTQEKISFLFV